MPDYLRDRERGCLWLKDHICSRCRSPDVVLLPPNHLLRKPGFRCDACGCRMVTRWKKLGSWLFVAGVTAMIVLLIVASIFEEERKVAEAGPKLDASGGIITTELLCLLSILGPLYFYFLWMASRPLPVWSPGALPISPSCKEE